MSEKMAKRPVSSVKKANPKYKRDSKALKNIEDKLDTPQILDKRHLEVQMDRARPGQGEFPTAAMHVGQWAPSDPRDTNMMIRRQLHTNRAGQVMGSTPYGHMEAGPDTVGKVVSLSSSADTVQSTSSRKKSKKTTSRKSSLPKSSSIRKGRKPKKGRTPSGPS